MPTDTPPPVRQYWEDLPVGRVLALGSVTVEREEVLAFARQYDPQPFHLDDEAAARRADRPDHTRAARSDAVVRRQAHA